MAWKYRPHRSTLEESMKECREFNSLADVFEYAASEWNIQRFDLTIKYVCDDNRIGWCPTYYICTDTFDGFERLDYPQCIGMCTEVE